MRVTPWLAPAAVVAVALAAFALPMAWAVAAAAVRAADVAAWQALWADGQWLPAWGLGLRVGLVSSLVSLVLALSVVSSVVGSDAGRRLQQRLAPMLAMPHLAFAIALGLLLMPSGVVARLLAPWLGWQQPPDVATVQDPGGWALVAGLVAKEVPFLVWTALAGLQRAGLQGVLRQQIWVARSMGLSSPQIAWQVLWPVLVPTLAWPLGAVVAYGLTVVDMAVVLGPGTPPVLGVLAWQWLLDASPTLQAQGAAAVWLLVGTWVAVMLALLGVWRVAGFMRRHALARGLPRRPPGGIGRLRPQVAVRAGVALWQGLYLVCVLVLAGVSVAGVWRFPDLRPELLTLSAWEQVWASAPLVSRTALLAAGASSAALLLVVAWLEALPARVDAWATPWIYASMVLPSLLLSAGFYTVALQLGLDGQPAGLWWVHLMFVAPYVWVALAPAYRAYDDRLRLTARTLGRGAWAHLVRVKWPVLRAPLASAFAIGFAVSVAQYLPTQFVGAGRLGTVTTEALTLAAGGQRHLSAAFAALQMVLPAIVLAWAAWQGRAR